MLAKKRGRLLECTACRRYCKIPEGQAGFCGVRANDNGKLNLLVYGKPCAVWIDPIEKKPFFHFLPGSTAYSIGTFGCDFACEFCQNWNISQAPAMARKNAPEKWRNYFEELLKRLESLPPEQVVENAIANGCKSIAFTYNEPTIFTEYAIDVMKIAHKKGIRGVYVTNGYESEECWDAISKHIDAANIDLKAFNQKFYGNLCKANLETVKESIKYVKRKYPKMWIEITTLLVPGENDDPKELLKEAEWLAAIDKNMPWHITAFHPDYKMRDKEATPAETLIKAQEVAKEAGIRHAYVGNLPFNYSNLEATICPKCEKEIIRRFGFNLYMDNIVNGKCNHCGEKISGVWK
jgi:pyruvate formate lyase activating enzyme